MSSFLTGQENYLYYGSKSVTCTECGRIGHQQDADVCSSCSNWICNDCYYGYGCNECEKKESNKKYKRLKLFVKEENPKLWMEFKKELQKDMKEKI